jgi:uncharacterized protein YbaP (TraB family)
MLIFPRAGGEGRIMSAKRCAAIVARFLIALLVLCPVAGLAATAPESHPPLWKVRNGETTIYILGSLHIVPPGFRWQAPEIDTAMRAADTFVFEVPVDDEALQHQKDFIIRNGLLPSGKSLRAVLSRFEFQTYSRILTDAGLRPEQYVRYRPWLAAVIVGLAYVHRRDITTLRGVDDVIIGYAQSQGKELRYLESIEQQMELLMLGNDTSQVRALKQMISALPNARSRSEDLLTTWASGDAKRFDAMIDADFAGHSEARDLLISNRNRAWLGRLATLLETPGKTALVTVGAAHLGGPSGLIALLCGQGHDVQRVGANGSPDTKACGEAA